MGWSGTWSVKAWSETGATIILTVRRTDLNGRRLPRLACRSFRFCSSVQWRRLSGGQGVGESELHDQLARWLRLWSPTEARMVDSVACPAVDGYRGWRWALHPLARTAKDALTEAKRSATADSRSSYATLDSARSDREAVRLARATLDREDAPTFELTLEQGQDGSFGVTARMLTGVPATPRGSTTVPGRPASTRGPSGCSTATGPTTSAWCARSRSASGCAVNHGRTDAPSRSTWTAVARPTRVGPGDTRRCWSGTAVRRTGGERAARRPASDRLRAPPRRARRPSHPRCLRTAAPPVSRRASVPSGRTTGITRDRRGEPHGAGHREEPHGH